MSVGVPVLMFSRPEWAQLWGSNASKYIQYIQAHFSVDDTAQALRDAKPNIVLISWHKLH